MSNTEKVVVGFNGFGAALNLVVWLAVRDVPTSDLAFPAWVNLGLAIAATAYTLFLWRIYARSA